VWHDSWVWQGIESPFSSRRREQSHSARVGTAIHKCIEIVISKKSSTLEEAWSIACDQLALSGPDPKNSPNAYRSFLRLKKKLPSLLELIESRSGGSPEIQEKRMASKDGLFRGQPDIVIKKPLATIIDHKSGSVLVDDQTNSKYVHQLLFYAYLVEESLSLDVNDAWLFSLIDGLIQIDVSAGVRNPFIAKARKLIQSFNDALPEAKSGQPSEEACKWCPHTNKCDFFWEDLALREATDFNTYQMLEGTSIGMPEHAKNNNSALFIAVDGGTFFGKTTISFVPSELTKPVMSGSRVRISHLRKNQKTTSTFSWVSGKSTLSVLD
jgi:RecB family exonuclease